MSSALHQVPVTSIGDSNGHGDQRGESQNLAVPGSNTRGGSNVLGPSQPIRPQVFPATLFSRYYKGILVQPFNWKAKDSSEQKLRQEPLVLPAPVRMIHGLENFSLLWVSRFPPKELRL